MTNVYASVFFILLTSALVGQTERVGIGTTDPLARLHVEDSSVLFRGTWNTATPSPLPIEGPGVRLMWYPDLAAFRAGRIINNAWDSVNIGKCSFAGGFSTIASQFGSTAFGNNTKALASNATAFGYQSIASGKESMASGYGANAESKASFAIGRFNVGGGDSTAWVSTDPLFEVGMGSGPSDSLRSNAMTVFKDGAALWQGTFGSGNEAPATGEGQRMMWYPAKGAFRAGYTVWDEWDRVNVGVYSVAFGQGTIAKGYASAAFGQDSKANGSRSFATGYTARANGFNSFSSGQYALAEGDQSVCFGEFTKSQATHSFALGRYNIIQGNSTEWVDTDHLFAIGIGTSQQRANALTVLKNGNVGIGTHTPGLPLQVDGGTDVSTGGYFAIGNLSGGRMLMDYNEIQTKTAPGPSSLYVNSEGGNIIFAGSSEGKVGIGTYNPSERLDVVGGARIDGLTFNVDETNNRVGIGIIPQEALHVNGTIEVNNKIQAFNSTGLEFASDDGTTRVKVGDQGDVGIGTVLPNRRLHVLGEARFESNTGGAQIILDGSSGLNEVEFQQNGAYRAGIGYDHTAGRIYLYHGGNVLVKSGNLGVGVDPTHKIDVSGGAYCDGSTWTNSSSRDLKENFTKLNSRDILEKVCGLEITRWTYKDDNAGSLHIGPMAEEFYAAFGLGQDNKSISTVDISGIALLTIQAQQAEINELNMAIEQLQSDKADMQQAIEYLLKRVEALSGENQ